jgi:3-hydroxyisobutyrate dehydrogenase-like beta-hydroxyacid dehydrogenase
MKPTVAVIAPGSMGAAVGQRLVEHGATVQTLLAGRSAATVARAEAAGLVGVTPAALAEASFILSIVPPGEALALAESLAPVLHTAPRKPIYVDCNAVNPETVARIAAVIAPTGCRFVDAGIIGGPPLPGKPGPVFYASGPDAADFAALTQYGLEIKQLDGPIGAASALKMSYAGITKGLTALGTAMILASTQAGAADALEAELADSQPELLAIFRRAVPGMFPKAYRWIAEMEEIAAFSGDPATAAIYRGIADLYRRIAADVAGPNADTAALRRFSSGRLE